jgi:hypothetical protein
MSGQTWYAGKAYLLNDSGLRHDGCACGAPAQHLLFRFHAMYPLATLKEASKVLHLEYRYTRLVESRLRRKDLARTCLLCFREEVVDGVCRKCGYVAEASVPGSPVDFDSTSPVHGIQPNGRGLGTSLDQNECRQIIRPGHKVEGVSYYDTLKRAWRLSRENSRPKDNATERTLSIVWQALKSAMPQDHVSDEAARFVVREFQHFRLSYPSLKPRGLSRQVAERTIAHLEQTFPELRGRLQIPDQRATPQHRTRQRPAVLPGEEDE